MNEHIYIGLYTFIYIYIHKYNNRIYLNSDRLHPRSRIDRRFHIEYLCAVSTRRAKAKTEIDIKERNKSK